MSDDKRSGSGFLNIHAKNGVSLSQLLYSKAIFKGSADLHSIMMYVTTVLHSHVH